MIETKDTTLGSMVSGNKDELSAYMAGYNSGRRHSPPVMVETVAQKLVHIKETLLEAGIDHIDVVYDVDSDKVRYYKRAMALEFKIDDNLVQVAHKLGWHKFE